MVLWWSLAYVGTEIFTGGGGGGGQGHTLRRLWYAVPHWWSRVFINIVIHVCFLLFRRALQSPTSRNSHFSPWYTFCLYIVVLVYNPLLPPLFLVNFMVMGSAKPSLSKMLLCTLVSYKCCSLLF